MIINLPAKDAQDVKDRTYLHPRWRMYETGLDAFHQLHCVVRLRLSPLRPVRLLQINLPASRISLESFLNQIIMEIRMQACMAVKSTSVRRSLHVHRRLGLHVLEDHCLDYLRQSIQCSADMTPIITYYQPAVGLSLVRTLVWPSCVIYTKFSCGSHGLNKHIHVGTGTR